MFDRWTAAITHYVRALLAYSIATGIKESLAELSLSTEEDNFGAEQYISQIEKILPLSGKEFLKTVALVDDNCSVNKNAFIAC